MLESASEPSRTPKVALGVRTIVLYKTAKASLQLGFALVLLILWPFGLPDTLAELARALESHVIHGWSIKLAEVIEQHATPRTLKFTILALFLDGGLTSVEAWALGRGRTWGAWLVVVATGALLPFEIYEFFERPKVTRLLIFVVNALIVGYLARRAVRDNRAHSKTL
jgi:uncharacterized membrane protein (DUF2068 family)